MDRLHELSESYLEKRDAYDQAYKESSLAEKEWRGAEREMIEYMTEHQVGAWKDHETKIKFELASRTSISITINNRQQVRDWLLMRTGDDEPYVIEVPEKDAVTKYVKELVASNRHQGDPDDKDIPSFLNLNTRPILRRTKSNA